MMRAKKPVCLLFLTYYIIVAAQLNRADISVLKDFLRGKNASKARVNTGSVVNQDLADILGRASDRKNKVLPGFGEVHRRADGQGFNIFMDLAE